MSSTPIFDATLADAPLNIWQAAPSIFPRPDYAALWAKLTPEPIDWATLARQPIWAPINEPRFSAKVTDPANIVFLGTVA